MTFHARSAVRLLPVLWASAGALALARGGGGGSPGAEVCELGGARRGEAALLQEAGEVVFEMKGAISLGKMAPCNPLCQWQCESPTCEADCTPLCRPPRCETRCRSLNQSACKRVCGAPRCTVTCPKGRCALTQCAECYSTCTKAPCHVDCGEAEAEQQCESVCAEPECSWDCKQPSECPAPRCKMECQMPKGCADLGEGPLPEPREGETVVNTFHSTVPAPRVPGCCNGKGPSCQDCSSGCAYARSLAGLGNEVAAGAMQRLQEYAVCMTKCEEANLCCGENAENCCGGMPSPNGTQQTLQQQLNLLMGISLQARHQLAQVRGQLDRGEAEAVSRASLQVALVTRDVQLVANQKLAFLANQSSVLKEEAGSVQADAARNGENMYAAARAIWDAHGTWHFPEAEAAINAAIFVESSLSGIQKETIATRRLSRKVDYMALDAIRMSTEAAVLATNASTMALQAVEQASQNSMKLKAITEMLQEFNGQGR